MKKLAIMFVMLLGSVATIQAQYFNFTCIQQAENAFSIDQQEMLADAFASDEAGESGSLNNDGGLYSVPSSVFLSVDISGIGNNMFYVVDNDGYFERTFEGLQAAVDYVSGVTPSQVNGIPLVHADYLTANGNFEISTDNRLVGMTNVYAPNSDTLIGSTEVIISYYPEARRVEIHPNGGESATVIWAHYGIVNHGTHSSFAARYSVDVDGIIAIALGL